MIKEIEYSIPEHWCDSIWLQSRTDLTSVFGNSSRPVRLHFTDCIWIDPQPLCDMFLQCVTYVLRGGRLFLSFGNQPKAGTLRVVRWLVESGFFEGISRSVTKTMPGKVTCEMGSHQFLLESFKDILEKTPLPSRALDHRVVIPCQFQDASEFADRDAVFQFCENVREEALAKGRAKSLGFSTSLAYQTTLFLNSILPEIIDNVQLHKKHDDNKHFAFLMRLRRREENLYGARTIAEPQGATRTELQMESESFWQRDIVELVFADNGSSIQQTWIQGWNVANESNRNIVPRLPESNIRVDGKHGDRLILEGVFTHNTSSMPQEERLEHGLSVRVTGLHSIRLTVQDSDCAFSVRSGRSYFVLRSSPSDPDVSNSEYNIKIRSISPYSWSPGVHYLFLLTSTLGRHLENWVDGTGGTAIEEQPTWWMDTYPDRFKHTHIVSTYQIPENAKDGDVIVCRVRHDIPKNRLYRFLNEISQRSLNLVFYELPAQVALWIYHKLRYILSKEIPLTVLIVTNNLRVAVVGKYSGNKAATSFATGKTTHPNYWWSQEYAPIRNIVELFACCRQHDSNIFWHEAQRLDGIFLRQPVKWSQELVLNAGYLSFSAALRSPELRKLLVHRYVVLSHLLRCTKVMASKDTLRHFTGEVERNTFLDREEPDKVGIIGSVLVTGNSLRKARGFTKGTKDFVNLPAFIYPRQYVNDIVGNTYEKERPKIRALDWHPDPSIPVKRDLQNEQTQIVYMRRGDTDEIRIKPDLPISFGNRHATHEMFSVWHRQALLSIGHYSYGRHHYFAWPDLRRFVDERSPDSQDMIQAMIEQIRKWKPNWIFYVSHEVTESLLGRLLRESGDEGCAIIEIKKTWPTDDLPGFISHFHEEVEQQLGTAVIVDDALVTGHTIRTVVSGLRKMKFSKVHSLVILDRMSSEKALLWNSQTESDHFAWWSLHIPSLGTADSCRICRAVAALQQLAAKTDNNVLREIMDEWISRWTETDNLARFANKVESVTFSAPLLMNNGGSPENTIRLRTSEETCFWALDLAFRLEWPAYLLEGDYVDIGQAKTESFAGLLLHSWGTLSDGNKRSLVEKLLSQIWSETRRSARSIGGVALLSLSSIELRAVRRILKRFIEKHGFPHIEALTVTYAVAHLTSNLSSEAEKWLSSLHRSTTASGDRDENDRIIKINYVADLLSTSKIHHQLEWAALKVLGLPGQSDKHQEALNLLYNIEKEGERGRDALNQIDDLLMARAYLSPVRECARVKREFLESQRISGAVEKAFIDFETLFYHEDTDSKAIQFLVNPDYMAQICRSLRDVLIVGGFRTNSLREVLSKDFVHNLPIRAWEAMQILIEKKHPIIVLEDFLFDYQLTSEEEALRNSHSIMDSYREQLLQALYKYGVVGFPRSDLLSALNDCMSDVTHPKAQNRGFDGYSSPPYMRISFFTPQELVHGFPGLGIIFENRASQSEYERSQLKTWSMIRHNLSLNLAEARCQYNASTEILRRELVFPSISGRSNEEMKVE